MQYIRYVAKPVATTESSRNALPVTNRDVAIPIWIALRQGLGTHESTKSEAQMPCQQCPCTRPGRVAIASVDVVASAVAGRDRASASEKCPPVLNKTQRYSVVLSPSGKDGGIGSAAEYDTCGVKELNSGRNEIAAKVPSSF